MEKYTQIYFILRYRERESRAKEITEIGYVTVTFQENTSDAGPTPHAFWNIADFDAKCEGCGMINTITLEDGELGKQD